MRTSTQLDRIPEAEGNRKLKMASGAQERDSLSSDTLSVALMGKDEIQRHAVARAIVGSQARVTREFTSYPGLDDLSHLLESAYDVIILELDSDTEHALDLVEAICATNNSVTVMVYSARADSAMLVRCMRAGAREFLPLPIPPGAMEEAMVRAMVRRSVASSARKALGKLMVFIGSKGGSGVTTVATNFSVAVAQESHQSTLLIDLCLPIGDAALGLGLRSEFSVVNALENSSRLDSNFFSKLLSKHSSGLSVLGSPDGYVPNQMTVEAVERLVAVARQTFDNVVVDAGSNISSATKTLFKDATRVYLITQVNITALRNSSRLITEFFSSTDIKLEIVLNGFTERTLAIDEKEIGKALTREAQWKIPSDSRTALRAQNTANALATDDSAISRVIRRIARTACGLPEKPEKKKYFSLFG